TLLGVHATDVFAGGAAEIVAFDPLTASLFIVNGAAPGIDVVDITDPTAPKLTDTIDTQPYGDAPTSVDVHDGVVAVAVVAAPYTDPGRVAFFDASDLSPIVDVAVGSLPDMVTFTPDGARLLVANEGSPDDDYLEDPEGTISVIDLEGGVASLQQSDVKSAGFTGFALNELDPTIRIFGPDVTVARDLEPEYIAVSADSKTAWVTLQENNALAIVDIAAAKVTTLVGLGWKDHSIEGAGLDPSDKDGGVKINAWPLHGMYQPDAIASFLVDGETYLVTANEGDSRDYNGFNEEARIKDLDLDPAAFPDAAALQEDDALGRLQVTVLTGDVDFDGDFDMLHPFGARSLSVRDASGALVYDSGDALEQITAAAYPVDFNSDNEENGSGDSRSDNKGPEPEGVTVATLWGKPYAFLGLERIGGIVVFDLSSPQAPELLLYEQHRDFAGDPEAGTAGDLGPEGLHVIAAEDSPTGAPLLVVAYEVSGTTAIYELSLE
ncbi:MAG: choice-of-anchor I family protein, partial [Myxococcales bacterium]|nr:choice-of-anchor I family protein [Myxococcales bacterium]